MRYICLKIANYRGVEKAKVDFAINGITLVRGLNETGKTSLGEAIWLLFEYPDNSKHHDIMAIKPVHRDEGPEIELEAESGSYRFTYFKRFIKRLDTRLTVSSPRPESLTGRRAHERAMAILQETLDVNLWRALSIRQGDEISQPLLEGETWLSAALDIAAGGHSADKRAENLFEQVHREYLEYYTDNKAERKNVIDCRDKVTKCRSAVQEIEQSIRNLEQDVERVVELKKESSRLNIKGQEMTAELEKRISKIEEIKVIERRVSEANLKLAAAAAVEKAARGDKEARERLIKEIEGSTNAANESRQAEETTLIALKHSQEGLDKENAIFSGSEEKLKETNELVGLRQSDYEYLEHKLDLEMMQERKARVDQARKNSADSKMVMEKNKVDRTALDAIEKSKNAVITAEAKLGGKAPLVLLRGLGESRLEKDGTVINLEIGNEYSYHVSEKLKLVMPKQFEVEISAGSSINDLLRKVQEAREKLVNMCNSFGIGSPDKAREAFEERQKASREIEDLEQIEKENLRDLSYDDLAQRILILQESLPAYLPNRVSTPPICDNLDLAKIKLAEVRKFQKTAESEWEKARDAYSKEKEIFDERKSRHIEASTLLDHGKKELARLEKILENERAGASDEGIKISLSDAVNQVAQAQTDLDNANILLKALNPELERDLEQTTRDSLVRIQQSLRQSEMEIVEVGARLDIVGEQGLSDNLNIAKSALEQSSHEYNSMSKRMEAVKLLYDTMKDEREKGRKAYIAPLKKKIESLGHLVFGDTLQVDIGEDLKIRNRTIRDTTVDFESLSGGTREQLSLIFRLACAMITDKNGGAPVMLDDALGYTDPERLQLMGAVLAKAAKECQIVIFTCVPDRYCNIGIAKEVIITKPVYNTLN